MTKKAMPATINSDDVPIRAQFETCGREDRVDNLPPRPTLSLSPASAFLASCVSTTLVSPLAREIRNLKLRVRMDLLAPEDRNFLVSTFGEALAVGALCAVLYFAERTVVYCWEVLLEKELDHGRLPPE